MFRDRRAPLGHGGWRAQLGVRHGAPRSGENSGLVERHWEGRPEGVKVPYTASAGTAWGEYLSTVGHEESCWNPGGPSSKAEYVAATDSAEVP